MITSKLLNDNHKYVCKICDYTTSKTSSYKKHMKEAADYFGYEELAKEYEEKPKKEDEEKGKEDVKEEIQSLIDLAKGQGNASEDSEESF